MVGFSTLNIERYEEPKLPTGPVRTLEKGYLKLSDGVRIYYEDQGLQSEHTPMVFLYGLICSQSHWKHQLRYLGNSRRCLWMDYRGHHNSDNPEDTSTVNRKQFAKDLKELLDYRGIKKVVLVGHSLGAQVSLEFVKNHPHMVEAMILAHGTAGNPCETIFRSNATEVFFDPVYKIASFFPKTVEKLWKAGGKNKFMHPITLKLIHYSGFHPTLIDPSEVKHYMAAAGTFSWSLFTQLLNEMRQFKGTHWLHDIKQPTLIISGEIDLITPPINQEIMNQLMPNSTLLKVPSGSHCAQMDRPGFVNRAIKDFLNSL